jgi:S-adenosylmethionine hydrolase
MIILFTDFGNAGPYVGQMKAVLYRDCPGVPIVDLLADAPAHNPRASAYLLAALAPEFPQGSVFLGVVDPGVGDPDRRPAAVAADGQWFVGPDNGLFNVVAARSATVQWWDIDWRPPRLSASFHGRDLFAPVAARIACGEAPPGTPCPAAARILPGWPQDLAEIVYIDGFGNVMTGVRAADLAATARVRFRDADIERARTFAAVPVGQLFWYENANGLVEIAVNQGSAAQVLSAAIGDTLDIV